MKNPSLMAPAPAEARAVSARCAAPIVVDGSRLVRFQAQVA